MVSGQTQFPNGLKVGGGEIIDTITVSGGNLRIVENAAATSYPHATNGFVINGVQVDSVTLSGSNWTFHKGSSNAGKWSFGYGFYVGDASTVIDSVYVDGSDITGLYIGGSLYTILYKANYYVATDGSDSNPGTFAAPFATLQKLVDTLAYDGGGLGYVRGGVYQDPTPTEIGTDNAAVFIDNKGGSLNDTCKVFAYPGETPVLDLSGYSTYGTDGSWGVLIEEGAGESGADYWHFKGLTIQNVPQNSGSKLSRGIFIRGADNIKIEECVIRHIGGVGIQVSKVASSGNDPDSVFIVNCDIYNNADSLTTGNFGDNADGIQIAGTGSTDVIASGNYFYVEGNRMYNNSDDGLDLFWNNGYVEIVGNWSFDNGYLTSGDGNGFKFGDAGATKTPGEYQRLIYNNFAGWNGGTAGIGFYENQAVMNMKLYNNTAWYNGTSQAATYGTGFQFYASSTGDTAIMVNNVSLGNYLMNEFNATVFDTSNSWNANIAALTRLDYVSVDSAGITGARQSDGSLPDIDFLKIVSGSDLADAGSTTTGLTYNQAAPDLGHRESNYTAPSIDIDPGSYHATATALITAMDDTPSSTRQDSINAIIQQLATNSYLSRFDRLWVPAAHSNTGDTETLDWITAGNNFTYSGAGVTFTANSGVAGNGTDYVNLLYNPTDDGTNFTQNDATVFMWITTDVQENLYDFGNASGASVFAQLRNTSNRYYYKLNCTTGVSGPTGSVSSSIGMHLFTRTASAVNKAYYNADQAHVDTGSSTGLSAADWYMCGMNGASNGTKRFALFGIMDGVTDVEQEELFNIFNSLKWW